MISYDDKTHIYSYGGRRYLSATQLVELFRPHFNTEERAEEHAYKHGMTPEHWRDRWEDIRETALERGQRIHNLRQSITDNRGMEMAVGRPRRVVNLQPIIAHNDDYLKMLPDGIFTEIMLWSHYWKIAGRVDRLIIESAVGYSSPHQYVPDLRSRIAHIEDYKTNRFIRMRGFPLNRECTRHQMMLPPIDHLEDCDKVHYDLQFSLYQLMAEEYGYQPGGRWIIHLPHIPWCAPPDATEPPPRRYSCEYRRQDVISMLTNLRQRGILAA